MDASPETVGANSDSQQTNSWRRRLLTLFLVAFTLFTGLQCTHESLRIARASAQCSSCKNNLKQMGLALHNYHDTHGCFPPVAWSDDDGRPIHSWRLLIFPFLEASPLYSEYNFSVPWDDEANLALMKPGYSFHTFQCPAYRDDSRPTSTSYVAVAGSGTAWQADRCAKLDDFKDGLSQTILLVEVSGAEIDWMEPRDLTLDDAALLINNPNAPSVGSRHSSRPTWFFQKPQSSDGVNVLMADGSVRWLPATLPPEKLRALLTIDGGEPDFDPEDFAPARRGDWAPLLVLFLANSLLFGFWYATRPRKPRKN